VLRVDNVTDYEREQAVEFAREQVGKPYHLNVSDTLDLPCDPIHKYCHYYDPSWYLFKQPYERYLYTRGYYGDNYAGWTYRGVDFGAYLEPAPDTVPIHQYSTTTPVRQRLWAIEQDNYWGW